MSNVSFITGKDPISTRHQWPIDLQLVSERKKNVSINYTMRKE